MKKSLSLILAGFLFLGTGIGLSQQSGEKSKGKARDPFLANPNARTDDEDVPRQIAILIEYFKMDHLLANKIMREWGPKSADVLELREELDEMIEKKEVELLETAWVLARSGQRAKTESIKEVIYPSEYDPGEIPHTINVGDDSGAESSTEKKNDVEAKSAPSASNGVGPNVHLTNPNPAAFETRNVGVTLEVDPVLGSDNRTIDLNLAPELVDRLEDEQMAREGFESTGRGLEHVSMPTFYTMKNTTQLTTVSGNYHLFAIHTPHDEPSKRIIAILKADVVPVK